MIEGNETAEKITIAFLKDPNEWRIYRDLCMQAAAEYSEVFGVYTREDPEDDLSWKRSGFEIDHGQKNRSKWLAIAKLGNKVVGMLLADRYKMTEKNTPSKSVELSNFYVVREAQGRGIGTRLLSSMMRELRKDTSVSKLSLDADMSVEKAKELYKEFGFKERYASDLDDVTHMSRMIRKSPKTST